MASWHHPRACGARVRSVQPPQLPRRVSLGEGRCGKGAGPQASHPSRRIRQCSKPARLWALQCRIGPFALKPPHCMQLNPNATSVSPAHRPSWPGYSDTGPVVRCYYSSKWSIAASPAQPVRTPAAGWPYACIYGLNAMN